MSHSHCSASPCSSGCDSCAVAAFDDELIDDGNIDWDWDTIPVKNNTAGCEDAAVVERIAAASTDGDSEVLSRIQTAVETLIAGEKAVQETKAATHLRRTQTLANYDHLVDDVIHQINDTRMSVKDNIRTVFDNAIKWLDAQHDELVVSIGQLQGLAVLNSTGAPSGFDLCVSMLDSVQGPVCDVAVNLPDCTSSLHELQKSLATLDVDDQAPGPSRLFPKSFALKGPQPATIRKFEWLISEWLPGSRFELLYRKSIDGSTAAAFHSKCDGKGPTVTLIRSENGCVFGAYAGSSWQSDIDGYTDDRSCFLFTITNTFGDPITKLPIIGNGNAKFGMYHSQYYGPTFGMGHDLQLGETLGADCCCNVSKYYTYGDPLSRGSTTFTGERNFTAVEVEVWQVL